MSEQALPWKRGEFVVLVAGLALFLALTCYQLRLPGPHYDEAIEVLPTMQLLLGQPVETFRGAGVRLGHTLFPVMVMDYIGAMNTYLALPFFALLGIDVVAMRLMPICFGAGTLLLTYLLARELFGRGAAAVALLTLAGSISFVFWSRQGIFVTNLTSTLMLGALWCGLRWWRGRGRRYLYLTAFLLGLGLYTKFIFLWAIGGMLGALLLLQLDRLVSGLRAGRRADRRASSLPLLRLNIEELLAAAASTLLPLTPLIVFNIQTQGTLSVLSKNFFTSYYGVDNLAFWDNLQTRAVQFQSVLRGDHFWYLGETFANPLWWPALLGCLAAVALVLLIRRRRAASAWRRVLFPFLMLGLMILQSCFTISALWFTHYAILTPLPPLALAGGLWFLGQEIGRPRVVWPAVALLAVALLGSDLYADYRYHQVLGWSGGYAAHSDASYELAQTLTREAAGGPVVALDWGIQAQVQFLTRGQVAPRELFGYESLNAPGATFADALQPYLANPKTLYLFHAREAVVYRGRSEAFVAAVAAAGKESRQVGVIYERSGRAAYVLMRVD